MSLRRILPALAVSALALTAPAAGAQSHALTFTAGGTVNAFGTSVGPYGGTLTTTPPGSSLAITLFCNDILNTVGVGETFAVFVSPLIGDLSNTRGGNAMLSNYKRAAWLSAQFATNASTNWAGIQSAMWESMSPGTPNGGANPLAPTDEAYWLNQVAAAETANYLGFDFTPYVIITDTQATLGSFVDDAFHQEFMSANSGVTTTPEPATVALLGAGLLGVAGAARARRRATV